MDIVLRIIDTMRPTIIIPVVIISINISPNIPGLAMPIRNKTTKPSAKIVATLILKIDSL